VISFALKLNPIIVKPLKTCLMAYRCRFFSIAYNEWLYVFGLPRTYSHSERYSQLAKLTYTTCYRQYF
jgi:hypothetical protein